ncbi:MAG: hypothetical protein AAF492_27335, partial [Verrucomicrobiota bacterium]
ATSPNSRDGEAYGSPLLIPMVGGSGAGGTSGNPGRGGGGGGGALLLASNSGITLEGLLLAQGGPGADNNFLSTSGHRSQGGSGGAIRLVAPVVSGGGSINAAATDGNGISCTSSCAGQGRIRVDVFDRVPLANLSFFPSSSASVGGVMVVFPDPTPRLDILEAAGQTFTEGTNTAVQVILPTGASTNQSVVVQARDFPGTSVPIRVQLTPENGDPTFIDTDIDISADNPASTTVNLVLPVNVLTRINAWTR